MNGKETRILRGVLMSPLAVGRRVLLFSEGRPRMTTTVVSIHGISDEKIHFETLDAVYMLLGDPAPQTACEPIPVALAA